MLLIAIAIFGFLLFVALVISLWAGSWGLSSITKDLESYNRKVLGKKAKKDAKTMLQLGYIIDRKWYDKTRGALEALNDWESQELWQKLKGLEEAERVTSPPATM